MVRFILGIIMLIFGVISLIPSFFISPAPDLTRADYIKTAFAAFCMIGIPGALLAFFGYRSMKRHEQKRVSGKQRQEEEKDEMDEMMALTAETYLEFGAAEAQRLLSTLPAKELRNLIESRKKSR
jgi:membrane-bound ClpP family serine protease